MVLKIRSGLAFGKDKGFKNTPLIGMKRIFTGKKTNYKISEAAIFTKNIVSEICGLAPYEKKAVDMIKKGNEKRAKKFVKTRLGGMRASKKKLEYLTAKANE